MGFTMDATIDLDRVPKAPDIKVLEQEIDKQLEVSEEVKTELEKRAEANINSIFDVDILSMDSRKSFINPIIEFGRDTMEASAKRNSMLSISVGKLATLEDKDNVISKSLLDLNKEMKALNPSLIDFNKTGLLSKLFNPIKDYFAKYEKASDVLVNISKALDKGKKTLENDIITMTNEEIEMRKLTKKLKSEIELLTAMDLCLEKKIQDASSNGVDPEKIKFVMEEIQFPLKQGLITMQEVLTVNQQGILSIELFKRNNKELMIGVDRAKLVSMSALSIGAMLASGLYNQKIVIKTIEAVNQTTGAMLVGISEMIKSQGVDIHKQAVNSNISVEDLQKSFDNCLTAIDDVSKFKLEALPKMRETIDKFKKLTESGEKAINKFENGDKFSF
ncbi:MULTISPECIES: toxic anion resistance protein [Clostridium]|uniref:toxic anion resistance protein n=1 Tax=Clostridium TaxID=1485 RepID=UPI001EEF59A4|nr:MULTISPECIES: toxic anion resistance protein [Clostridium]WRY52666.1 toxic anion resistance protein [Clostridium intestinale]